MIVGKSFVGLLKILPMLNQVLYKLKNNSKIFGKHPTHLVRGLLLENLRYISSEISKVGLSNK